MTRVIFFSQPNGWEEIEKMAGGFCSLVNLTRREFSCQMGATNEEGETRELLFSLSQLFDEGFYLVDCWFWDGTAKAVLSHNDERVAVATLSEEELCGFLPRWIRHRVSAATGDSI